MEIVHLVLGQPGHYAVQRPFDDLGEFRPQDVVQERHQRDRDSNRRHHRGSHQ